MDKLAPKDLMARICELEEVIETLQSQCEGKIKNSLAKYRRLIDATSEGFLELDHDSKIVDFNATIVEMIGIDGEDLINCPVENLYDKESTFVHFASKEHLSFEANFRTKFGNELTLLFKRSILRDNDGIPSGFLVFLTELTELKKAQDDLQHAETKYGNIYRNAAQGMYQCALDGRIFKINPAFVKIFGYEHTVQFFNEVHEITSLYKDKINRQHLLSALKKDHVVTNYEVEMRNRDGKPVWVMINARLDNDEKGNAIIDGILIDNTKKRFAEDQLRRSRERFRYLSNHDSLTGLFNTRYLYKTLDKLIIESDEINEPFSLVFLDMDNFKHIVDTYGHLNGSQALKEVAETLKTRLIDPAFGVAYGGDEFVLVLPQTGKNAALEHVREIRLIMKETVYLTKKALEVHLSASFGVATYPNDAKNSEGLLALADEAMFHVKLSGKDAVGVST